MGKMEAESTRRSRNAKIRTVLLGTVQATALLTLMMAAPNAIQGFHKLGLIPSGRQVESTKRSYLRLLKGGYLKYEGRYLRLTPKGERELIALEMRAIEGKRSRRWDGKWRVIIFDIAEKRRSLRITVRRKLQDYGFARLQDSVWVYPYDCEDLITLLKAEFKIGRDMLYMIVEQIEADAALRKEFKLKH